MSSRLTFKTDPAIRLAAISAGILILAAFFGFAQTNEVEQAMVTDSDGDGATDWEEWQAGTNPGDPTNCFEISNVSVENGQIVLDWKSVGTLTYEFVSSPTVAGLATNPQHVAFITATGGTAPWFQTLCVITNQPAGTNQYLQIRLVPPPSYEQSTLGMATLE